MARNDKLLEKEDPNDISQYDGLIKKAFQAKRKIETGFIELAESIFEINQKKLYRLKYNTFREFCEEELGFSRQTIYVYISSLNSEYPAAAPSAFAKIAPVGRQLRLHAERYGKFKAFISFSVFCPS